MPWLPTLLPILLPTLLLLACPSSTPDPKDTGPDPEVEDADGDGFSLPDDCDDDDATAFPGAPEACNGTDDDCDGRVDEDVTTLFFQDDDGDGWGTTAAMVEDCEAPTGFAAGSGDCDDANPDVHPAAPETCDGLDQDCDGSTDEEATDAPTWYCDLDGDGVMGTSSTVVACEAPTGCLDAGTDCDDTNPAVHPAVLETCNDVDDDCDGEVDEDAADRGTWFPDLDTDGWGETATSVLECEAPIGWVAQGGDCDDADPGRNPASVEICDGLDQDCDGSVDDGVVETFHADGDGDGFGDPASLAEGCVAPSGTVTDGTDCDDTRDDVHPGAAETCDGADQDCDGTVDDGLMATWYPDEDHDGFGNPTSPVVACTAPPNHVPVGTDCDDTDARVVPGASEVCDGADNDCNGTVDDGLLLPFHPDADGDGAGDAATLVEACAAPAGHVEDASDCDDARSDVFPGASEVCDTVDNDCDGSVDEGVLRTWYLDADTDGWGDPTRTTEACSPTSGAAENGLDCDDTRAEVNPGAPEVCDSLDNDCDENVDEGLLTTWYPDADGDGFGSPTTAGTGCAPPSGTSPLGTDCDDDAAAVYPGAPETCNGVDDDCDTDVDEGTPTAWYPDADGDGWGGTPEVSAACAPTGHVATGGDCDDTDATAYPDSPTWEEPADGVDQDCDGWDGCTDLDCDTLPDIVLPGLRDNTDYDTETMVFFGDDHGTWEHTFLALPAIGIAAARAADLDGDGFQDLVLASLTDGTSNTGASVIYWGSPTGPSTGDTTPLSHDGAADLLVEDLDGDRYPELVFAAWRDGSTSSYKANASVWWGSASGYDATRVTELPVVGAVDVAAADLDEDGYTDLVFANQTDGSSYTVDSYVYWGSATGYDSADRTDLETEGAKEVLPVDLDVDGWTDLVFACWAAGSPTSPSFTAESVVYWGSSSGPSSTDYDTLPTEAASAVASDDLDMDGRPDLVFAGGGTSSSSSATTIFLSDLLFSYPTYTFAHTGMADVAIADLDADGLLDIVLAQALNGTSYSTSSYVLYGQSYYWPAIYYTTSSSSYYTKLSTSGAQHVVLSDVDEDGWPDLLFSNYQKSSSGFAIDSYLYLGSRSGFSDREYLATNGAWGEAVVVGP